MEAASKALECVCLGFDRLSPNGVVWVAAPFALSLSKGPHLTVRPEPVEGRCGKS